MILIIGGQVGESTNDQELIKSELIQSYFGIQVFEFPCHRDDFARAFLQESRELEGCEYIDLNLFSQLQYMGRGGGWTHGPSVSNLRGRNLCPLTSDSQNLSVLFVRLSLLT